METFKFLASIIIFFPKNCESPLKKHRNPIDGFERVRAQGEVAVQRDTHHFRGSVQQGHLVTDSHLREESGLVGVRGEQCHAGFLGSNGQLLATYPPRQKRT